MGRLCERPGCSENAALAYGMRPEDLVFWVDVLREHGSSDGGVLCQRHGDSMTVPRGWTLDDLRDPDLHLFRPPPRPDGPASRRNRARRRTAARDETGQLALGGLAEIDDDTVDLDAVEEDAIEADSVDVDVIEHSVPVVEHPASDAPVAAEVPDAAQPSGALAWKPAFDDGDDLDGLLAARSPLLSRGFRGERT